MLEAPGKVSSQKYKVKSPLPHQCAGSDLIDADACTGIQRKQGSKETQCWAQMPLLSDSSFRHKFYNVLKGWAEEGGKKKKRKHSKVSL